MGIKGKSEQRWFLGMDSLASHRLGCRLGKRICQVVLSRNCWWGCKLIQPLWKSVWRFLRKLDTVLPEAPATPLLGIYPREALTYNKDTCTTMFIAALFIIARSWKGPRCPSVDE